MAGVTRHVRGELVALAEGRLTPGARRLVEAHLASCQDCRHAAGETWRLVDELGASPQALARWDGRLARAWPGVWARMHALPKAGPRPHLRLALSLASAAMALLVTLPVVGPRRASLVTAGLAATPVAVWETEAAFTASQPGRERVPVRLSAGNTAQPVPIPTPVPDPHG